jgi:6,7-dimethyl-8-ribityllumazine synthase
MTRVLIVEARFYAHISDALFEGAVQVLEEAGAKFERIAVPGALEIPGAIKLAAGHYDGFIALGCVIRGETYHFEIVANESARGLMDLTVREGLAIGNGILTVEDEEQALVRARAENGGKGGDAVRACLALMTLKSSFAKR